MNDISLGEFIMYRLFIAIDPPGEIKRKIISLCHGLKSVKWVDEDQIHLTLRFIGETDGFLLDDICRSLTGLESPLFSLKVNGVGHFPPRGEPKVIWAGLENSSPLIKLYGNISRALTDCGIERESRKFSPHITLGRVKGETSLSVASYLSRFNRFRTEAFTVNQYHLYSSRLTPRGAIHEKLASFLLGSHL